MRQRPCRRGGVLSGLLGAVAGPAPKAKSKRAAKPVSGSAYWWALRTVYFFGAANLIVGLVGVIGKFEYLQQM